MERSPAEYSVSVNLQSHPLVRRFLVKVFVPVALVFVLTCVLSNRSSAQIFSGDSTITLNGLVEAYYLFDFDKPATNNRPAFLYSYTRTNEVTADLAYLRAHYADSTVRGGFALMAGTYAEANLAGEPSVWRNVFEASAGVRLSRRENLWLDAGIFPSHIGFESAVGKDNWTLTRSLAADNSPYYESGAKVTYTSRDNAWTICALVLNGWQQIQRPTGNTGLSWGTQVTFQPNADLIINSSTFIGNTKSDEAKQLRLFHNLYGVFSLSSSLGLTLGFDIGSQQKVSDKSGSSLWLTPIAILRFRVDESKRVAIRGEYYQDNDGVIIATGTTNGFQVLGGSMNFDYAITNHSLWRLEGRVLSSKNETFVKSSGFGYSNSSLITSLTVFF